MKRVTKENNLNILYPDIAKQWHPSLNKGLTPSDVHAYYWKKVWWICKRGHVWEAEIAKRTVRGTGCPYCSGNLPIKGETDLATLYPKIAKQWHPSLNKGFTPNDVTAYSHRKAWWVCDKGHEWITAISGRTSKKAGCPYCSGNLPIKGETDLATLYPEIAKQWHPSLNKNLTSCDVTAYSTKKIWWICNKKHEWNATIEDRTKYGHGCPYCSGRLPIKGETDLATLYPDIAKQWHPSLNKALSPNDVTAYTHKKVWWICSKGHEWEATIGSRTGKRKSGCPYCSGHLPIKGETDLATLFPEIAADWNYEKNRLKTPENYTAHSGKKVWWKCDICGFEWRSLICSRTERGSGCPKCN